MDTISYWLARLKPLLAVDEPREVIVVLANRTRVEGDAVYVGTSAVIGIERGHVKLYGVLGHGEKELLMVDTSKPRGKHPFA
jgi:protein N-terminal amidase